MKKLVSVAMIALLACQPMAALAEAAVHETPAEWLDSAWKSAAASAEQAGVSVEEWLQNAFTAAEDASSEAIDGIKSAIISGEKKYGAEAVEAAVTAAKEVGINSWEWIEGKLEIAEESAKAAGVDIEEWFTTAAQATAEAAEAAGKDINAWLAEAAEQANKNGEELWNWLDENVFGNKKGE